MADITDKHVSQKTIARLLMELESAQQKHDKGRPDQTEQQFLDVLISGEAKHSSPDDVLRAKKIISVAESVSMESITLGSTRESRLAHQNRHNAVENNARAAAVSGFLHDLPLIDANVKDMIQKAYESSEISTGKPGLYIRTATEDQAMYIRNAVLLHPMRKDISNEPPVIAPGTGQHAGGYYVILPLKEKIGAKTSNEPNKPAAAEHAAPESLGGMSPLSIEGRNGSQVKSR